jgi:hypothetical protein
MYIMVNTLIHEPTRNRIPVVQAANSALNVDNVKRNAHFDPLYFKNYIILHENLSMPTEHKRTEIDV